jgi:hypothetical protein
MHFSVVSSLISDFSLCRYAIVGCFFEHYVHYNCNVVPVRQEFGSKCITSAPVTAELQIES